jgi:uncharacterized protein (TIGR02246 family)
MVKTIEQIARAFLEAEASRDLDRIVSFFTPDADWGSATSRRKGRAAIREYYAGSAAQFPRLTVEAGRVYGNDAEAALEWHAVFTDRGGRTYPLSGVSIFRREGDLIGGDRVNWDPIFGAACPMRRCSDPHEIATAVAFLASEEASYITGADLIVDGGLVSMTPDALTPYEFG